MNFDTAIEHVLKSEGLYSDHPSDPGGKTMYGITEAVAREVGYKGDMRDLPLELAKRVYKDRYWDKVRADQLPAGLRLPVLDAAVNSGPGQAIKWLQRSLGVKDDGVIGPVTIAAANAANPDALRMRMLGQRLRFMAGLNNWPAFSRGWAIRIASLME